MKIISPIYFSGFSKRNWLYWLSDDENSYMRQYPRATIAFCIIMWTLFLLPSILFVYSLIVLTRNDVYIVGPLAGLGLIGCILIGWGFGNIIAAFMHIYLGHRATIVFILAGAMFILITYYLIFLFA